MNARRLGDRLRARGLEWKGDDEGISAPGGGLHIDVGVEADGRRRVAADFIRSLRVQL